jgi:hypothetical protein
MPFKTVTTKDVNDYPKFSEKEAIRTSTTSTLRRRDPTNPHTASKVPNMVFDHSQQLAVWPDGRPASLIEATQTTGNSQYKTMNKTGRPYALGTMVGGSPDQRGTLLSSKSPKVKITK